MLRYALLRLLLLIPTILGMTAVIFFVMHNTPGSPFENTSASRSLTAQEQAQLEAQYGLDKPGYVQYFTYIRNALRGDFGESFARRGQEVSTIIGRGWRTSLYLGLVAMAVAIVGGGLLGMLAAARQNSPLDYICTVLATLGVAFPNYIIGVFLVYLLVLRFDIIPRTGGFDRPVDWVLPVISLSLGPMGIIARYVRSSMVEVIRSDYVRTARAKGAGERRVMVRHVLKNGLIPPLTIIGPLIAAICTGSPAIEFIFRIPGIGRYFAESIVQRDYAMILAVVLIYGIFLALMNLFVDLLYGVVDPRIRYS